MNDLFGLLFFVLLIAGIFVGLRVLSKPKKQTPEEFERKVSLSGSMIGASMGALQGILDPSEGKAKEIRMQLKEGRYQKKKREGKGNGSAGLEGENNDRKAD
jgi:hypothetical protein